jgi:hypothetical protein
MSTSDTLPLPTTQPTGFKYKVQSLIKSLTTRDGLLGDYSYKALFTPNIPWLNKSQSAPPFFGLNDRMPWVLAVLLGFKHSLAMLAGVVTPSLILGSVAGVALEPELQQYLVSTALIVCGLLSSIQITRFRILKTK